MIVIYDVSFRSAVFTHLLFRIFPVTAPSVCHPLSAMSGMFAYIYNNVYSSSSSFRTGWKEMSGQVSFFREKVNQKSALRDNTTICIIFRLQNYYIFLFGCYTILSVNDIIMQKCIIFIKNIEDFCFFFMLKHQFSPLFLPYIKYAAAAAAPSAAPPLCLS